MTVWRGLFVALLISICWRSIPCLARIETVKVNEKSGSAVLVGELFGMAAGGFVNFDVEVEMDEEESEEALSRCVKDHSMACCYLLPVLQTTRVLLREKIWTYECWLHHVDREGKSFSCLPLEVVLFCTTTRSSSGEALTSSTSTGHTPLSFLLSCSEL